MGEPDGPLPVPFNLGEERIQWRRKSDELCDWILERPPAIQKRMRLFDIRCKPRGCLLGRVYKYRTRVDHYRYIWIGTSHANVAKCGILNWGFSNMWSGPKVYFWCGCEHGQGKVGRTWMLEAVGSLEGWHTPTSIDQDCEDEPIRQLVVGMARRTFHPQPEFWTDAS